MGDGSGPGPAPPPRPGRGAKASNWGRWGEDDEIGLLNLQDERKVLEAVGRVRHGVVVSLGQVIGRAEHADPVWPGRLPAQHRMVKTWAEYHTGRAKAPLGGVSFSSDDIQMSLHGGTHVDALGHVFHEDRLYNGREAASTVGGLAHGSVRALAERGIVLPAVLADLPRRFGDACAQRGFHVTAAMVEACLAAQGATLAPGSALLLRTGWIGRHFAGRTGYGPDPDYNEPGLTADPETVAMFADRDIVLLGTDTLGNEQTWSDSSGHFQPLHRVLIRDLGVIFLEILDLDPLAQACARHGQYEFCLMASPLKIQGGTASPVNPLAIL